MSEDYQSAFSKNPSIHRFEIGREAQPIIRIDGFMENATDLVRFADEKGNFTNRTAGFYPGLRAPLPKNYVNAVVAIAEPLIRDLFDVGPITLVRTESVFSLVVTPSAALSPLQRIPHIDTPDPLNFALLHFLCDDRFGGTSFYRQKATGFETITHDRIVLYRRAREREVAMGNARGYVGENSEDYDRTALFESKFDRMLIYRSNLLHSGYIPNPEILSTVPARGRLTANIFVSYVPRTPVEKEYGR